MTKKHYIQNEQLTTAKINHAEDKITIDLYDKTRDISTLHKFLSVIQEQKHDGLPIFGEIRAVWKIVNIHNDVHGFIRYFLPLRTQRKNYKIYYYWNIESYDSDHNYYEDKIMLNKWNTSISRLLPVNMHKKLYDNMLDMNYTDTVLLEDPYNMKTSTNDYNLTFEHYYGYIKQLNENERVFMPRRRKERLEYYKFE